MEQLSQLSAFFDRIGSDGRIGVTHISLYMSLFQLWNLNVFQSPVSFTRQELMALAKINARATYHKCMKELHEYGYIRYIPSYNPALKSMVYFIL